MSNSVGRKHPWFKFYPADWRSDPRLRSCSFAAQGLWIAMLGLMHEADPVGHLTVAGRAVGAEQLSRLTGGGVEEIDRLLSELRQAGVYSLTTRGVIYSRRMVRDARVSAERSMAGARGGAKTGAKIARDATLDADWKPIKRRLNAETTPAEVVDFPGGNAVCLGKTPSLEVRSQRLDRANSLLYEGPPPSAPDPSGIGENPADLFGEAAPTAPRRARKAKAGPAPTGAPTPVEQAVAAWNEAAARAGLPRASARTPAKRAAQIAARLAEDGMDGWLARLARIERSALCCGGGESGWRADIDWLCRPLSWARLVEGAYDTRPPRGFGAPKPKPPVRVGTDADVVVLDSDGRAGPARLRPAEHARRRIEDGLPVPRYDWSRVRVEVAEPLRLELDQAVSLPLVATSWSGA